MNLFLGVFSIGVTPSFSVHSTYVAHSTWPDFGTNRSNELKLF